MKIYVGRIQHSCGYPELPLKASHILTPNEVYRGDNTAYHNFTCTAFKTCEGEGFTFECEKALTRYRVIVFPDGRHLYAVAYRSSPYFKSCELMQGHRRLIDGSKSLSSKV